LKFEKVSNFMNRLDYIYQSTLELMEMYSPDEVAFESLIYVKNPSSLIKLAQARGAMVAAVSNKLKDRVHEYSPNLIKTTVSGDGHATKDGIQKSLELVFGKLSYKSFDESDALAIAFCHALNAGSKIAATSKNMSRGKGGSLRDFFKDVPKKRELR
jgi:crossover junction endodeoxyribonuclease RuvC